MAATGRPREFDREEALHAAMLAFWRKGFLATSMNDLCEAMGIRSPSVYAAFGSKEALYLEALALYAKTVGPPIWGHLRDAGATRACIEKLLVTAAESLPEHRAKPGGCMVALAGVGDECPAAIAENVKEVRLHCLAMLRARLGEAVAGGELARGTDVDRLARFYFGVYQGMAIQAHDGAKVADLKGVAETAMAAWPARTSARRRV